jgi:predicted helicase
MSLITHFVPNYHLAGAGCGTQSFPFDLYDEDGTNRRENITDWALNEFRTHYGDANITKWDIFHYVYAVLHHPEYRTRYAANLKRELARIPFMAQGGRRKLRPIFRRSSPRIRARLQSCRTAAFFR